jgi:hypothetical protein
VVVLRDDPASPGDGGDRRGDLDGRLDRLAERIADIERVADLVGLEPLGDVADQPPRQGLGDLGLEQAGVGRHQFARQVGQQVVEPAVLAQILDHRVEPAELLAEV